MPIIIVVLFPLLALVVLAHRLIARRTLKGYPFQKLWDTGTHTEYGGPGRVRFLSLFGGAGYVIRLRSGKGWGGKGPSIAIPGVTLYWRTHASLGKGGKRYPKSVCRFRITRNPNRPVV